MTNGALFSNGMLATRRQLKSLTTIKESPKMVRLKNIHPGEILQEEFLTPFGITTHRLSKDIGIPQTRVSEILKGNRCITADMALWLSKYFGNSAKFWLGLQADFDLEEELLANSEALAAIPVLDRNAA